jgi:hypothetical protein
MPMRESPSAALVVRADRGLDGRNSRHSTPCY